MSLQWTIIRLLLAGICVLSLPDDASAQAVESGNPVPAPRPSSLFLGNVTPTRSLDSDSVAGRGNPALTGAIIGGVVLGTAVAIGGYQFCESSGGSDCGGVLGLVGGFLIGAVVGSVIGGFIGSAIGS